MYNILIQDEIPKIGKRVKITMKDGSFWNTVKLIGVRIDMVSTYLIINDLDNEMEKSPENWYNYIAYEKVDMVDEI